jgi:hypothetical protein
MVHIKYKYIYSEISSTSKQVHLSETLKYTEIQVHLSENPSVPKVYLGENLSIFSAREREWREPCLLCDTQQTGPAIMVPFVATCGAT